MPVGKGAGEAGGLPKSSLSRLGPVMVKEIVALPARQDAGNSKRAVELRANYFGLTFTIQSFKVYKYTFKVLDSSGEKIKDAETKDIVKFVKGALPSVGAQPDQYATDFQRRIVSLKPLKLPKNAYKRLEDEGSGGWAIEFGDAVEVQLGNSALISPSLDVIACLNLVVGHSTRGEKQCATVRRHRLIRVSDDPESKNPFEGRDIPEAVSAVYREGCTFREILDVLNEKTGAGSTARLKALINIHGAVAKSRVSYELPGKNPHKVRIAGFARRDDDSSKSKDPAHPLKIERDFPRSTEVRFWFKNEYRTVWGHFKKERDLEISKDLPLVNIGKHGRPEYVPAEYCRVLASGESDKLNKSTCRLPENKQILVRLGPDSSSSRVLSSFHVVIHHNEPLKVTGRELNSPQISYCEKQPASVRPEASWKLAERSFAEGPKIKTLWAWIYLGGYSPNDLRQAEDGAKILEDVLNKSCAKGLPPRFVKIDNCCITKNVADIQDSLARAKTRGISLVVVISPNRLSADMYNALKLLGDVQTGIHTSCILLNKFKKKGKDDWQTWNYGYFRSVALKINLKLDGTNHKLEQDLDLAKKNTLIVMGYGTSRLTEKNQTPAEEGGNTGGDQPSEEVKGKQSQVGIVISADEKFGQWLSSCWNQDSEQTVTGTKLIHKLETQLRVWKSRNAIALNKPMVSAVIYRYGVSESQFEMVLQQEVPVIKKAFEKEFNAKQVQITLVVAIKGHATRFFPMGVKDGDLNRNIKPGTLVDNVMARPRYREFFLASHFAHKGNTRPARYVVLVDEIFQNGDAGHTDPGKLEKFTYDLCYLFGRGTQAVSVCTPAYYIDILCTRARAYNAAAAKDEIKRQVESNTDASGEDKKRILAGEIHKDLTGSMHWI